MTRLCFPKERTGNKLFVSCCNRQKQCAIILKPSSPKCIVCCTCCNQHQRSRRKMKNRHRLVPPKSMQGTIETAHLHPREQKQSKHLVQHTESSGRDMQDIAHHRQMGSISTISDTPPNIVLDGQNIARFREFGVQRTLKRSISEPRPRIDAMQIKQALDFFVERGMKPVALLPQFVVDERRGPRFNNGSNRATGKDLQMIKKLHERGLVFYTPGGTHDDYYIISFGMRNSIPIVSNDKYRKEKDRHRSQDQRRQITIYLRDNLFEFAFRDGRFTCKLPRFFGNL